jgi:DnaJ like chaperone protein
MSDNVTPFARIYQSTQHRQSACVLAVLTWIATCDGIVSEKEQTLLNKIAEAADDASELQIVESAIRLQRTDDLLLACRFLQENLDRGARRLMAELAITMAVQDGSLSVGENHLLQFIADLLGLSPRAFAKLFQQITHRPLPEAGDPSSIAWWQQREAGIAASPAPNNAVTQDRSTEVETADGPMTRKVALNVMGLDEAASSEKVHQAYRRLAKLRHPDRFASLGPAAVATATDFFKRLHEAYAVLSSG